MKVTQLMVRPVRWCLPTDDLNVAARLMWEGDCGCVPVCVADDEGEPRVIGMLTDRDVAMAAYTQGRPLAEICARTAMAHEVITCRPTDPVAQALLIMQTQRLHRLPVVEAGERLVGILSLSDIARAAAQERALQSNGKDVDAGWVGRALQAIHAVRGAHELTVPA